MRDSYTKKTPQKCDYSSPPLRPSFREALSRAKEQLEFPEMYDKIERPGLLELIYVIAEVYLMSPDRPIRISGEWLDGYAVQEVFSMIERDHLIMVKDEFERIDGEIKNKKAYLRTMLYNSVFSFEAHYTNLFNCGRKE